MHNTILNFPQQLKTGLEAAKDFKLDKNYWKIIVSGMGGSIIPAEIALTVQELSGKMDTGKIFINRNYGLPLETTKENLSICISWSGNTEETISSYNASLKMGLDTIVITKGGKLAEESKKNKNPLILIDDEGTPPRLAIGYMTSALLKVLGLEKELEFNLDPSSQEKEGKDLAEKIGGKTPVIYASYSWRYLAKFWKILFNENSKTPAFWNYLPGLAHNELAGFTQGLKNCHPIIIRDTNDDPRQNKNIDAAIAIFNKLEYAYTIVNVSPLGTPLEKMLNNYVLALWASYYLGKSLGVDPEDTKLIEDFKKLKKV